MNLEEKLDKALYGGKLNRRMEKREQPGDVSKEFEGQKERIRATEKPTIKMPSMHEVPHLDGTAGHVPKPGKPVWFQRL